VKIRGNILIITPDYPPTPQMGGVAVSVQRIARLLTLSGFLITVVSIQNIGKKETQRPHLDLTETYNDGNILVIRPLLPERRDHYSPSETMTSLFEWLCEYVEKEKFDLIHSFYISSTGYLAGLVAKETGIKHICSVRGNDLHKDIFTSYKLVEMNWAMKNAEAITFVSDNLYSRTKYLFSPPGKLQVIWNGISLDYFLSQLELDDSVKSLQKPVIGIAGVIRRKKGFETLIHACENLHENITLLVIGEFRDIESNYWENFVLSKISSQVKVKVTGAIPHSHMLEYYKLLDVLVIPSTHDGCPNVLLESMLAGVPVISTTKGAMKEIIEKCDCGFLFEVNNKFDLANKIRYVLNNPVEARKKSEKAKEFILENLDKEHETKQWVELYDEILRL